MHSGFDLRTFGYLALLYTTALLPRVRQMKFLKINSTKTSTWYIFWEIVPILVPKVTYMSTKQKAKPVFMLPNSESLVGLYQILFYFLYFLKSNTVDTKCRDQSPVVMQIYNRGEVKLLWKIDETSFNIILW